MKKNKKQRFAKVKHKFDKGVLKISLKGEYSGQFMITENFNTTFKRVNKFVMFEKIFKNK